MVAAMRELSYATGWYPWIPQTPLERDHPPQAYAVVEICRAEWDAPQCVDPWDLGRRYPLMNAVGLWWRPVREEGHSRHILRLTPPSTVL
jgi:hypothetical protein